MEVSWSFTFWVNDSRYAAAIMGISLSIFAARTMFFMKFDTLSAVGLKQSIVVGSGSSKIFRGCVKPKSTLVPPKKEDSIIFYQANQFFCGEPVYSSPYEPSEYASSSHTSSYQTYYCLQSGWRKLSFRIYPTSSSISSVFSFDLDYLSADSKWVLGCGAATTLEATNPEKAQTSSQTSILAIVEDIKAPSKERFKLLTLSISKLISITFLVDIGWLVSGCCIVQSNRAKLYLLGGYMPLFLTVGLVAGYTLGFFFTSMLLSLFAEYFVFMCLAQFFTLIWTDFFYEYFEWKVFFFWSEDCGVNSFITLSSCFSQSGSFLAKILRWLDCCQAATQERVSTDSLACRAYELLAKDSMILSSLTVWPGRTLISQYSLFFSYGLMRASLPRFMPYPRCINSRVYCCKPVVRSNLQAGIESQHFLSQRSKSSCASAPILLELSLDEILAEESKLGLAWRILNRWAFYLSPSSNFFIYALIYTNRPYKVITLLC